MKTREMGMGWEQQVPVDDASGVQAEWRKGEDAYAASCYRASIPPFVENAVANLYGSLYSSLPLLRAYQSLGPDTNTWILQRNGSTDAIFLYRVEGHVLKVINEGMRLDGSQVRAFCRHMFSLYPDLHVVRFASVQWEEADGPGYPYQHFRCLENIVLPLPSRAADYHAGLSKNLRRNLKRYGERLVRDFPGFHYEVLEGNQVDEAEIRAIIELNIARMRSKNKVSAYDEEETARMVQLVRGNGLVGIGRVDGKVCAGALAIRTGDNYALSVLAHDPAYNDYSMGILSAYRIICACIERGAVEFQFLWGRYDYKYLLGAANRELEKLAVYRSWLHVAGHAGIWLGGQIEAWQRRGIELVQQLAKEDTRSARIALAAVYGLRALRRALRGGLA